MEVIPTKLFLCAFIVVVVVWMLLFFNTRTILDYIFVVIVLDVNGPLE